ncbi:hypothetical protein cand_015590 [Cryptosporidium andersoni]|uniref:LITAF domain-containing protein n=1 Tax=Cryptosporidium andersoni TaxID=117008 RepID=A0A1J4MUJ8_9CRYT|nr:hypothetical protein cand_015590 [Cryptosporidium andersoni]
MKPAGKFIHFEVEPVKHEDIEDLNAEVKFEDSPVECTCPFCKEEVVTQVQLESSWFTYLMAFTLFLVLGWISCPVLPLFWSLLQDSVHTCPRCLNKICRNGRIKCPSIKSEVMTVRCGSCAVVLSRKYVFVILLILITVLGFTLLRTLLRLYGLPDVERGLPTEKTWLSFLENCGTRSYLGNPIRAIKEFEDHYQYRTVSWSGRIIKVQEGFWKKHFIYIGMDPPQITTTSGSPVPDLALAFNEILLPQVAQIKVGDLIEFEATLVEFGKRGHPHFGQMWNFTKVDDFTALNISPRHKNMLLMIPLFEMMNQITDQLSKSLRNSTEFYLSDTDEGSGIFHAQYNENFGAFNEPTQLENRKGDVYYKLPGTQQDSKSQSENYEHDSSSN